MDSQLGQRGFFHFPNVHTSSGAYPLSYSVGMGGGPFPIRVKQSIREGDHSTHSSAEVNSVAIPPVPPFAHLACMRHLNTYHFSPGKYQVGNINRAMTVPFHIISNSLFTLFQSFYAIQ
jgi:hypothetical protein